MSVYATRACSTLATCDSGLGVLGFRDVAPVAAVIFWGEETATAKMSKYSEQNTHHKCLSLWVDPSWWRHHSTCIWYIDPVIIFSHLRCYKHYYRIDRCTRLILDLHPANERQRYFVTASLIGWVQAYNHPWCSTCITHCILQLEILIISYLWFFSFSDHCLRSKIFYFIWTKKSLHSKLTYHLMCWIFFKKRKIHFHILPSNLY